MGVEGIWNQLWGIGVIAIAGGVSVVLFLLLYYWFRGNPVLRCPWCGGELFEVVTDDYHEERQECSNPGCELKAIILKKADGLKRGGC